jgi:hypothetical protein
LRTIIILAAMTDWEVLFREAGLKIERVKKHITDLDLIERNFLESEEKSYEVFIEHDANGGDDLLKVKAVARLPDSYALTLGDAIHNLRTSLDYIMNDIEFVHTGKRSPYTKFPASYETKESLRKSRTQLC